MRSVAVLSLAAATIASLGCQAFANTPTGDLALPAYLPEPPAEVASANELPFSIDAVWLYGPTNGYVQVPLDMQPANTHGNHPTLEEMGIQDASIYGAQATVSLQRHELYLGGEWIDMSGSGHLAQPPASQIAPAEGNVDSTLTIDSYHLGYRYHWSLDGRRPRESKLSLYPSLGAAILCVDYEINAGGVQTRRSFAQGNAEVGLEVQWKPVDRLSLLAGIIVAPPAATLPGMVREQIVARYLLVDHRGFVLGIMAGLAFEQISWHDNQDIPTQATADFGPMLLLGLRADF